MQFWVYILKCSDGSFYTGHTDRIDTRVGEHNAGLGSDWTRRRRPVELVWCEALPSRDDAFAFERRLKGWSRAKKEALIARDWDRVKQLAWSTEKIMRLARPERSEAKSKGALAAAPANALRLRAARCAQDERSGAEERSRL